LVLCDNKAPILFNYEVVNVNDSGKSREELISELDELRRSLAEAKIQQDESGKRLKEMEFIINQSPVIVFLWRAAEGWPVEYVSESIQQFGYTPDDFYSGRVPYATIVHPEDLNRVGSEVGQYTEEGAIDFSQEYRILTAKGEVRWTDDRTWIRRDDSGRVTHYQGIVFDITERKQAELVLAQSREEMSRQVQERTAELTQKVTELERVEALRHEVEARQWAILDATPVPTLLTRPSGEILYSNSQFADLMGISLESISQYRVTDFYYNPADRQRLLEISQREGRVKNQELNFKKISGEPVPVSVSFERIMYEGAPAILGPVVDMTALKKAEAERMQLQQEIIAAQQRALKELATPIIPIMEQILVMPLIGSIDTMRARDITHVLLEGIGQYRAKVIILDITGVPIVDSGVVSHLNKTVQAARLKGARTIVTGVSDAVAETIVDLGIDWSNIDTLRDLQSGLVVALESVGMKLIARRK